MRGRGRGGCGRGCLLAGAATRDIASVGAGRLGARRQAIAARRARGQAGVTLLELLMAVTLFALLTVSSGIVLRVAFTSMNVIEAKVDLDRRVNGSQRALDQMLHGIMAVQGACAGVPVAFQGTESVMRFVSSYSLQEGSRGRPQIVELMSQQKTDGTGFRLVVNEYPYIGRASLAMVCSQPPQVRQSSFILADQLAYCRFLFKALDPGSGSETWVSTWMIPAWPRGVRVEMQPRKVGENRLQSATLSVPIVVRRAQIE